LQAQEVPDENSAHYTVVATNHYTAPIGKNGGAKVRHLKKLRVWHLQIEISVYKIILTGRLGSRPFFAE
jgi:hypothetical protein